MPEVYKIQGYTIETKEIYDELKEANVKSSQLKKCDKNGDKKITEDEYAEFDLEDEEDGEDSKKSKSSSSSNKYSDDAKINSLENEYDNQERKYYSKEAELTQLRMLRAQAEYEVAAYAPESEERQSAQGIVDNIQGKIDSVSSEADACIDSMADIRSNISKRKNEIAMEEAKASSGSSSGSSSSSSSSKSSNSTSSTSSSKFSYTEGSGKELTKVTGDLSICLDRVASSLGTDRSKAADYIATLCKTVGKGYFNPKVILSLVFSESGGDNSASSTPEYVGFGQMSSVAVQEVNNQFGTNFSFADMKDPAKNLKAVVYLLRFQYERYGKNLGKALTAYNVGNCESGNINGYAQTIMSRV